MSLPTRPLGRNGPQVTATGFGLMSLGGVYGQSDTDAHRLELLDRAYEIGERFWDTADAYMDSEDVVGKWFGANKDKRNDVFLATKFGLDMSTGELKVRSDPEYVKAACAKSLERLNVDHINLYYCHRVDRKTPIETIVKAMVELKNEGKIHHIGLSEVSASTLRRAHAIHPISAVQLEYSPFALEIEDPAVGLLATCRELGVALVAYSPLGRGFLTGQIKSRDDLPPNDFRLLVPKYSAENFPKILEVVKEFEVIAEKKGCTSGQITLAWLLAQGEEIIPIPGTRSIKYLEQNVGALKIELTEAEKKEIRDVVEATKIEGARYPEGMMAELFADTPPL